MRSVALWLVCTASHSSGRRLDRKVESTEHVETLAAFLLAGASSFSSVRRAILPGVASSIVLPSVAHAAGPQQGYEGQTLAQISPEAAMNQGFGRPASKSRPATGVVLVEKVREAEGKDGYVSADLILDGGVVATVSFNKQPSFELSTGMYTDVEIRTKKPGVNAFLQVVPLPDGKTLSDAKDSDFMKSIFAAESRYGAYGPPYYKVLSSKKSENGASRSFEVSFDVSSPSGGIVASRAAVTAVQPKGSNDAVMLVCASSKNNWDLFEPDYRKIISSFRVDGVRSTKLPRKAKSDYRFEDRGGFRETQGGEES